MSQPASFGIPSGPPAPPSTVGAAINATAAALLSMHSGPARPAYAVAGTLWCSTAIVGSLSPTFWDGSHDIALWSVDTTTGLVTSTVFALASHSHTISQVSGLQTALDGKAAASHTHTISGVTGLQSALDAKLDDSQAGTFGLTLLGTASQAAAKTALGLSSAPTTAATANDVRAGSDNTKFVTASGLAGSAGIGTVTFGSPSNWDMSAFYNGILDLTGNTTLNVSNPKAGLTYSLLVRQDATGGRTVTWPSTFNWGAAGPPTLSGANHIDSIQLFCTYDAAPYAFLCSYQLGY